jgi:hypothetical protein
MRLKIIRNPDFEKEYSIRLKPVEKGVGPVSGQHARLKWLPRNIKMQVGDTNPDGKNT